MAVGGWNQGPSPLRSTASNRIDVAKVENLSKWDPLPSLYNDEYVVLHTPRSNPLLATSRDQLIVAGGTNSSENFFIAHIEIIHLVT